VVHKVYVDRLLNVKSVLQSQTQYLFTKIHGVISHISAFAHAKIYVFLDIIKLSTSQCYEYMD